MNYRNFEKNIKDKLYNAEADLDINQFIKELDSSKEKRRRIPFLPMILVGTVLIATSFFFLGKHSSHMANNYERFDGNATKIEKNNPMLHEQSQSQSQPLTIGQEPASEPIEKSILTSALSESTKATKSNQKLFHNNSLISSNQKPIKSYENEQAQNDHLISTVNAQVNESVINPQDINAGDINLNTNNDRFEHLLTNLPLKSHKLFHSTSINIPLAYTKDVQCPTFAKKSNIQFSFIPEVGYFGPLKSLANNVGENPIVYDLRNKNEKSLEGLQAALYLQVQKKSSPFYLRAGVNYAQMTEKMSLQYTYSQRDTSIGVISITVSQTGDTITTIYGEIITETQKKGTKVGHHKFQLLDLPVSIGYEKPFGGFNLGAEIGASFNISMSASGKLLENSIGFKEIALDSPYKSNLGVNYFGSIFISKEILENQSIYAALRGRYLPSHFTDSGAPITEKYSMVGLHIGYKINF